MERSSLDVVIDDVAHFLRISPRHLPDCLFDLRHRGDPSGQKRQEWFLDIVAPERARSGLRIGNISVPASTERTTFRMFTTRARLSRRQVCSAPHPENPPRRHRDIGDGIAGSRERVWPALKIQQPEVASAYVAVEPNGRV